MYQVCTCPQSNLTDGDPHCSVHGQPSEYKTYSYCESCVALRADLAAANAAKEEEQKRKEYYQNIVYAVCNVLDKIKIGRAHV